MNLLGFSMGCADVEMSRLELVMLSNTLCEVLYGAYSNEMKVEPLDQSDKVEGLHRELKAILRKMNMEKKEGRR